MKVNGASPEAKGGILESTPSTVEAVGVAVGAVLSTDGDVVVLMSVVSVVSVVSVPLLVFVSLVAVSAGSGGSGSEPGKRRIA